MTLRKLYCALTASTFFTCSFFQVSAYDVSLTTAQGEVFELEFHAGEPLHEVVETLHGFLNESSEKGFIRMDLSGDGENLKIKAFECSKSPPRNYYASVSAQEKKDITYILKTLSNSSLVKIGKEKGNLKKAGDRIANIHPFKFLETVFSDEELKVCIRNLEGKSWVWTEFRDGITSSLSKESAVDNLKHEYIEGLGKIINVDIHSILPTIHEKNWSKLLSDLIAIVPRGGEPNRYSM